MIQDEWNDEIDRALDAARRDSMLPAEGAGSDQFLDHVLQVLLVERDVLDDAAASQEDIPVRLAERLGSDIGRETDGGSPVPPFRQAVLPRRSRRMWVAVASLAAAVVALAVIVPLTRPGPAPSKGTERGTSAPSWRLVSAVDSPFRALPPGSPAAVQCVTDDVCYSPGYGATAAAHFYRTSNGGQTWHATTPLPLELSAPGLLFSCSNSETCAALGAPRTANEVAELAYTGDGGTTWTTEPVPWPTGMYAATAVKISCAAGPHCAVGLAGSTVPVSGSDGYPATDDTSTFLSTPDGGQRWSQAAMPALSPGGIWTMTCAPNGSCLAIYAAGGYPRNWVIGLRSTDWGATWSAGPPSVYNSGAILYASCGDATHCMLVPLAGPDHAPYEIATTSDAGLTWQVAGPPKGWSNIVTAVDCATGSDCWIATADYDSQNRAGAYSQPNIEVTHDGGQTWSALSLPSSKPPIADVLSLSCPTADGCLGIANLADHFVRMPPAGSSPTRPVPLSGPLVISNLPAPGG